MMRRIACHTLMLALLLALPQAALADDRNETVKFAAGESSATRSATIKGYDGINYQLDARAGQVMQVLFTPSNRSCYFNIFAPGDDTAVFNGSITGNEFGLNLVTSGTYTFQVYLMRNAARRSETCKFSISFEITG
ncbi:hypothetical protein [Aestuariivirga sp.]|uniref:hypothetical protein n=1 Tax=Aestuariivirga sp. TaxID=2650926 RepID=UPI003BA8588B